MSDIIRKTMVTECQRFGCYQKTTEMRKHMDEKEHQYLHETGQPHEHGHAHDGDATHHHHHVHSDQEKKAVINRLSRAIGTFSPSRAWWRTTGTAARF